MADDDIIPSKLRVTIFDEADLALEETKSEDLAALFDDDPEQREYTRLTFLVGASVTESLGNLAVRSRILPEGKSYIATATRFAQLQSDQPVKEAFLAETEAKTASLKDLSVCLDPGLRHERVVVANNTGLLTLTRLLRKELRDYEQAIQSGENVGDVQRPRVVVFFPDEADAKASIESLRDAMWGEHKVRNLVLLDSLSKFVVSSLLIPKLCVLLPKTGVNPLRMMEQFKNNETTVMLATPNSVRGLDFPALTHVYTLYLPMDDPREYVHLAGRVGRVGQTGSVAGSGGRVISILKEDEAGKMSELARELGFQFIDVEPTQEDLPSLESKSSDFREGDIDKLRRYFEDKLTLLELGEDPEIDIESLVDVGNAAGKSEGTDDDEEEEEEEEDDDEEDDEQPYQ
jgi:superfamily II DNA/RNA helicase